MFNITHILFIGRLLGLRHILFTYIFDRINFINILKYRISRDVMDFGRYILVQFYESKVHIQCDLLYVTYAD